jgi:hypothetical protein
MGQMLMPSFGDAFGLANQNPVGGFVASPSKPVSFHKGLEQMDRVVIGLKPIKGYPSGAQGQNFRGQTFNRNPGKHEKSDIIDHQVEVVFPRCCIPADEKISGLHPPGSRAPAKAGHRPILQESDVFEMSTDNLAISQIMVPVYEAVVERLKGGVSNRVQSRFRKIGELALQEALIDRHPDNDSVALMVVCVIEGRRKPDKTFSLKSQEELPTGHIAQFTIGLHPVPALAERPRDLFASPALVGTDDGLDLRQIIFSNGSSANRERQHIQRIAKQARGRQLKMHATIKNILRKVERPDPIGWVENEKGGLKIARLTGSWSY